MKQLVSIGQPSEINNISPTSFVVNQSNGLVPIVPIKYVRILTYNWCGSGRALRREHHDGVADRRCEVQETVDGLRDIVSLA